MIKKLMLILIISLIAFIAISSGQEQDKKDPCENAMTTVEMQQCLKDRHRKADAELNQVYGQLMSKLGDIRTTKLRQAQRAWITFRDKSAEFEASEEEGGSMYNLVYMSVLAEMTEMRVDALKEIIKRMEKVGSKE